MLHQTRVEPLLQQEDPLLPGVLDTYVKQGIRDGAPTNTMLGKPIDGIFLGRDAFKVVKPDGMGIEHIAKDKGTIGGPLNQFATIGGKFETAAKIVYPDNVGILECVSSFSMIDEANYVEG